MNATGEETKEERAVRCRAMTCTKNVQGACCKLTDTVSNQGYIRLGQFGICEDWCPSEGPTTK
jgi:hypothetical protein